MLTLISSPIGNIADISNRALDSISASDIVLCEDTRVAKKLFSHINSKLNYSIQISEKKFIAFHSHNENDFFKTKTIDFSANILYISDAGSPCVSDPGALLVSYCQKNNIDYDFIGGVSAFLSAYVMSGFLATSFVFYGFLPQKHKAREDKIKEILSFAFVGIIYEAPHRILRLVDEISKIEENRELFIIKEISKMHQTYFKDTAINLKETMQSASTKGEWVVVVDKIKNPKNTSAITMEDVLGLDISKKQKAKLISKLTGDSTKDIYAKLALEEKN